MRSLPWYARSGALALSASCVFGFLPGCGGRQMRPTIESSASAAHYALDYPAALEASRKQLADDKTRATELTNQIRERQVKVAADPKLLVEIVERADRAGRSRAFVTAQREARAFRAFWEQERGAIAARVSAATQKQISEANCQQVDVSAGTSHALREGFERQLEKRVREHDDAQELIERERSALGPAGVNELSKFADEIAYASYLVNVALIDDKDLIEQQLGDRRDVEHTLSQGAAEERRRAQALKSKEERKQSEDRAAELDKSRSAIATAAANAEAETREIEHSIEQARTDYQLAFDAARERLRTRPAKATR
jgi:hypothetical protein